MWPNQRPLTEEELLLLLQRGAPQDEIIEEEDGRQSMMRDRSSVANSLRGTSGQNTDTAHWLWRLPQAPKRDFSAPRPDPDFFNPVMASYDGGDASLVGGPLADRLQGDIKASNPDKFEFSPEDIGVLQSITAGTETVAEPVVDRDKPFEIKGDALANQSTRWLLETGRITNEDAAFMGANAELPSEVVARIGLGMAFIDQYPEFRDDIERGDATGLIDSILGKTISASGPAKIHRRIATGQDAIRRLLSGAALNQGEVEEYVARYSPSLTDDAASLLDKTDQLDREIRYAIGAVMLGRGSLDVFNDLRARAAEVGPRKGVIDNPMEKSPDVERDADGWRTIGNARVRVKPR